MYAEVWLEEATRQFDRDWTYLIPPALADQISPVVWLKSPCQTKTAGQRLCLPYCCQAAGEISAKLNCAVSADWSIRDRW